MIGVQCENAASPTQVVSAVKAHFVIRGQTIALFGLWALNGVQAHVVLCIRSQAVAETET